MTEKGDAQFYLLGPLPEQACELCVSRIGGRTSSKTDRAGCCSSIGTSNSWRCMPRPRFRRRSWLMVRAITLWCAIRNAIHEKIEPLLVEGEELFVQLAPQLAAFA